MLRNVQQMALDAGIETVLRIAPSREVNKDFYSEWPIPIEVIGNYHTLGAFFDRILHFPRIFNIDDFSITALPGQSAGMTISARFTARTYFFLEESLIKKPDPAKPKKSVKETNEN
jgi:type IV pilus assembly protein PilO